MIIVTVELVKASTGERVHLGSLKVYNDGTGTPSQGNYVAELRGKDARVIETCTVRGFPRRRRLAWDLIYRVLRACRGDRNGDAVTQAQRDVLLAHTDHDRTPKPGRK